MPNSMNLNAVEENERDKGKYEVRKIDGKTAFVFDSAPSLIFISENGEIGSESLYINGREALNVKGFSLDFKANDILTFTTDQYALGMDAGKDVFSTEQPEISPKLAHQITINLGINPNEISKLDINKIIEQIAKSLEKEIEASKGRYE
ncbi:hypothetical protein ACFSVM_25580 [Paenibacillus shunpengii]|uniref:Uncharacterized protein n=1 Tax=Paenibacillus shunpengii TaxID=2054424 RepID=A0ABW5SYW0_9BACL